MTSAKFAKSWDPLARCLLRAHHPPGSKMVSAGVGLEKRRLCTGAPRETGKNGKESEVVTPPEPQDCCMSGCANCVWIRYAEEMTKMVENGDELAKAKIMQQVKDPNLRAFLKIELDYIFNKRK